MSYRSWFQLCHEYLDDLQAYLRCDNARLYVIDDTRQVLAVTDTFMALPLPPKNGVMDTQSCLVSFEKSALHWGMELFEYYWQKSKEIKSR